MSRPKSAVQTRVENGRVSPCVNVKVYGRITPAILAQVEREYATVGFADWAQELLDSDKWPDWTWEAALEQGWEWLREDAPDCFKADVKVYSSGRSGGWCIVEGLPPVESWDAVTLGRWWRFEKSARAAADGIPYDMAVLLAINTYEQVLRARRAVGAALTASAE